jgi:hypothetical protein
LIEDQLGNKVTTSIKNQAINKTEGLLNNSVNEFLNAFGAGRSEVSIGEVGFFVKFFFVRLLRITNRKSIKRKCD